MADKKGLAIRGPEELIQINSTELSQRVEGLYAQVSGAADRIIESAQINDLGEAANVLVNVKGHMNELKLKESGNFLIRKIQGILRKAEAVVKWEIKKRQSVKKALEESKVEYQLKRKALKSGIEDTQRYAEEAGEIVKKISQSISEMEAEVEALEGFSSSLTENHQDLIKKTRHAIDVRKNLLADLYGAKTIHEGTVVDIWFAVQEREALYIKLGSLIPVLDTLLKQQLASLISRKPIREANRSIQESKESLRELAKITSRMAREDAVSTAKAVNDPIFDSETLNEVAENIVQTCDETREAINQSIQNQEELIKKARESSEKIQERFRNFQQGK